MNIMQSLQVMNEPFTLKENEVHVWQLPVLVSQENREYLQMLLAPDEVEKASRFYFEHHRVRWTAARGLLRYLLGHYLKSDPKQILFVIGEYGKPALQTRPELQFNISHAEDMALYAFSWNRKLGIDVEYTGKSLHYDEMGKFSFSAHEYADLQSLSEEEKPAAFFRCWTRKEAYIKAIGKGLSFPLKHFDVSLKPSEPAQLLYVKGDTQELWSLHHLEIEGNYCGALVVEGHDWVLQHKYPG